MADEIDFDEVFQATSEGGMHDDDQENLWQGMWSTYMKTFDEYDKRITNAWKDDAGDLLVFIGLFSAIVGAFIIESYKKLSPDSGDRTVVLLGQISQQLAGFTNGTYSNLPATQPPSIAIILVNAMWLISLVLSITSALFATLLQQWARRYIEMPQVSSTADERARVRSVLFLGIQQNKVPLVAKAIPTFLHISVFLFFAGIVIFFFTIHKAVAIAVAISVGIFVAMYATLTILPYFGDKCPYRTPMSDLFWYPWYALLFLGVYCRQWVLEQVHSRLGQPNNGQAQNMTTMRQKLLHWKVICKNTYDKHRRRLRDGIEESIIQRALQARIDVDHQALTRLFHELALANENDLLKFVASIPRDRFVRTIMTPPIESGKIVLRQPLIIIRDHVVSKRAERPDEREHTSGLLVWLTAIHHITKVFIVPGEVKGPRWRYLLYDVRVSFADIRCMQPMWTHSDTGIRIISCSICALLAKGLLQLRQNRQPSEGELLWLEAVIEMKTYEISNSLDQPDALDHMILRSFVCRIFPCHEDPPIEHASFIAKTLATLMDAGTEPFFDDQIFTAKLSTLVRQLEGDPGPDASLVADKLRQLFPEFIKAVRLALPPIPSPLPSPAPSPAPSSTPAPALSANALRCSLRAMFRALGLIHEPTPEPLPIPGP